MKRWVATTIIALSLALWAGGGLTGCRGAKKEQKGVVFWHSMAGQLGKVMQGIIDEFNETHPETPIVPVYQGGYDMLSQKIRAAVLAGEPPDMAQMYEAWTAYLNREKGEEEVLPLNDFIANDPDFDQEDIFPVLTRNGTFDGQVLAMPFNKSFPVVYYNKEMFSENGLDPEAPPRTWDEFAEIGRKLTKDQDGDGRPEIWGWSFTVDPQIFLCMVLQNGGTILSATGKHVSFDGPPAVKALQWFLDAVHGPQAFAYRSTGYEPQSDFMARKVAMVLSSSVSKSFMKPFARFDMGIAPIPQGKTQASVLAGTNVGIFKRSPPHKQKVAWDFLKFFTNTENTAKWAVKTNYMPVRHSALETDTFRKALEEDPTVIVPISQIDHARFEPRTPQWVDCRKTLNEYLIKAIVSGKDPARWLAQATSDINTRLRRRF